MFKSDRFLKTQTVSLIEYVFFHSVTACFLKKCAPLKYITNFTLTFLVPKITNKNNGFHNCKQ